MSPLNFLLFIPQNAPENYHQFWRLWQDENFFAAHEALEDLWRVTQDEHRVFFNGLIHAAVALYQHRRGNFVGAARQNVRMQEKLKPYAPQFYGVQIDELMRFVNAEIAPSLLRLNQAQSAQLALLQAQLREKFG